MNPDSDKIALLEAIAQQQKINLYERFTEESASVILNLSIQTLRRIRARGEVAFIQVSERRVEYFGFQVVEYLLSKIEEAKCPAQPIKDTKLETIGFPNRREVNTGAAPISTTLQGRQDALASAQRILKKPSKS
jgi:hypothetical protein